jgi:hypothetical protein
MVNVYLNIGDRQVLALSIPFSDIERLSVRPVKWLRFVTFAICGVRGDISATPNGPPVNYDSISLAGPIAEDYYYTAEGNIQASETCCLSANILVYAPVGDYQIIDPNGLNDRFTSSEQTIRSSRFRIDVEERDGPVCVFTGTNGIICDAAHLLPKSKGDEVYICRHCSMSPAC